MTKALQVASLLALGIAASAAAQRPAHTPAPRPHAMPEAQRSEPRGAEAAEHPKSFGGVAEKLGTTPQALQSAYDAAKAANPKLTRGQFIAANVVAHNLGSKNPAITTQAILDGLKSGKSIVQTLRSLGVSDKDADEAEKAADQQAKEAESAADKAGKTN
ncbi:MAG TPA: hypothetical protein VH158_07595 [Gemmatimonadales bacterium]|nr:hypothetical protein [Gemmatimonadales bacterium]